jgi:hypothetical protein
MVTVGTRVPAVSLRNAAIGLGLPPGTSKSAIMRAALAMFHEKNPLDYIEAPRAENKRDVRKASAEVIDIAGPAHAELAEMPAGVERATAIRIGLALASGWTREEAESFARMTRGPKPNKHASGSASS